MTLRIDRGRSFTPTTYEARRPGSVPTPPRAIAIALERKRGGGGPPRGPNSQRPEPFEQIAMAAGLASVASGLLGNVVPALVCLGAAAVAGAVAYYRSL